MRIIMNGCAVLLCSHEHIKCRWRGEYYYVLFPLIWSIVRKLAWKSSSSYNIYSTPDKNKIVIIMMIVIIIMKVSVLMHGRIVRLLGHIISISTIHIHTGQRWDGILHYTNITCPLSICLFCCNANCADSENGLIHPRQHQHYHM